MKNLALKTAVLAMSLFSLNASSASKYDTHIVDSDYVLDISKYQDYHRKLTVSDNILNDNVRKTHEKILKSFQDIQSLEAVLEPKIREMFEGSGLHYRWFNFDVSGPIEVKLSGTPAGTVKIELSEFNLYGKVKAEKSWYLNVYATLSMNNADISGEIDLSSGEVRNVKVHSKFDFDFDSSINFLFPFFDSIIENYGEIKIRESLSDVISNVNGHQTMYGLDKVIPANKFIYDGIDIGWELEQQLTSMLDGQFIKMTIKDLSLLPSTRPYACYEPGNTSWSSNFAEFNISNKAFLRIGRKDTQYCKWNGSGGQTDY